MCKIYLFPVIFIAIFISVSSQSYFGRRRSDFSFSRSRGNSRNVDSYLKPKPIDGDFVFPNSNLLFPSEKRNPYSKGDDDLKGEGTGWIRKIKDKWNDLTNNFRKSEKSEFYYLYI